MKSVLIHILSVLLIAAPGAKDYYSRYMMELGLEPSQMEKHIGKDTEQSQWLLGIALEAQEGNWAKVEQMTAQDRHNLHGTYYHNLAKAMQGRLAENLLDYYQPFDLGLFLPVDENSHRFTIEQSTEVWFHLGEMTIAEHGAILGMAFSPNHYGIPFYKRLAEINLINGQEEAAMKYLKTLAQNKDTRKWALSRMPGKQSAEYKAWLDMKRAFIPKRDFIHGTNHYRAMLLNLLDSNPANTLARQYLLCYDILTKDIGSFMEDYNPAIDHARVYDEAVLIYLASTGQLTREALSHFGIDNETLSEFTLYNALYNSNEGAMAPLQEKFGKTYWFYFHYATRKN